MFPLPSKDGNTVQIRIQPVPTSTKHMSPSTNPEPGLRPSLRDMISHPMGQIPPGYQYSAKFSVTRSSPPESPAPGPDPQYQSQSSPSNPRSPQTPRSGKRDRTLSSNRREQNRNSQRAFRARRHLELKELETRSTLLDAALASVEEANRRLEEYSALIDKLRVENAALRVALSQDRMLLPAAIYDDAAEQPKKQ
ncbi:hypothetical protein B0H11DRAFT_2226925 [Mycena galericulata]|nr:hypothetical protein B0H11DRAFT_2226925 [Mycena galericulata]